MTPTKNTYRVVAISREDGKRVTCYEGDRASMAIDCYTDLTEKRPTFFEGFKVVMERLEPVIVMESD